MTITRIILPADFGNDGPRDAEIARQIFRYEDGKLIWKIRQGNRARIDAEAGSGATYKTASVSGKSIRVHRIVWLIHHDAWPVDQIDHMDGDPSNNRIENLRSVTNQENMQNIKRPSRNKSGVMGVSWFKKLNMWTAQICVGKKIHLGCFHDIEDAIAARKTAEIKYGFHENHGR